MKNRWKSSAVPGPKTPLRIRANSGRCHRCHWDPNPSSDPTPPIYRGTISRESFEGAGIVGDNAFIVPWLTGPHRSVRKRVQRYRTLLDRKRTWSETDHLHLLFVAWTRTTMWPCVRDRAITRAYTDLFTSMIPAELLTKMHTADPVRQFIDFARAMPDQIEERAVVGTPAECRRRLHELDDEFTLDQVAFYFHAGARDPERARHGLELFANEGHAGISLIPLDRRSGITASCPKKELLMEFGLFSLFDFFRGRQDEAQYFQGHP